MVSQDRSVAYARVTHPVSQSGLTSAKPKTLQIARNTTQMWEQEVAEFEEKYTKKVVEDAKILALKSIMPENSVRRSGCIQRKIVQLVYGLARSCHQLPG